MADKAGTGTLVDLFCGCGGFSLGAELAGFRTIAAIDVDPILQSGYRRNFSGAKVIQGDVGGLGASAWRQFIGRQRPDVVIGGPPCQGFSRIGKKAADDPRNTLIHAYFQQVRLLSPKIFVMENVEGLLDGGNGLLETGLEVIAGRYKILGPFIANAADFGAATARRRVVVVGYDPAEVDPITLEMLQPAKPRRPTTVRDAISDLPSPIKEPKDDRSFGWAKYPLEAVDRLSRYAKSLRRLAPEGLGWAEAIDFQKNGFVSGVVATRHSKEVAQRYRGIVGGKTDQITKSYRLEWDGQCPTLRAGTGSEKGAFQAVRPLHPAKSRVITVREAARLQGFPDWFVFHPTKWHSFRMIGNSVSPIMSHGLFAAIAPRMRTMVA